MVSKNNNSERLRKSENKNNRFSIRKFTVGAASVLIGSFFIGVAGSQTAHAETTSNASTTEQVASASTDNADSAKKADQAVVSDDKTAAVASDASSKATNQVKDDSQDLQSQFDQAAQNPGKPASSANTALNNASDADLTEMANDYNASKAQNSNPNPAQSESEKDGHTYAPTNQAYSDPKTYIGNADKMPVGTKYSWITSQSDLSKMLMEPGQHTISILVTYPDGSTTTVTGPYLNVTGNDVQTVTITQGRDASSININDAVTDIVPAGNMWDPQSAKWTVLPDTSVAGVTMGQAEVVYASGNKQSVIIPVRVTPVQEDVVSQDVDFRMPGVTDSADYYYKTFDSVDVYKTVENADGQYSWNSVTFDNQPSLDSILSGDNFTYNMTGYRNYSIPAPADGYIAKIVGVQVTGGDPAGNDPLANALLKDVSNKVKDNPYALPTYTVPAGETHGALSVVFQVTYVPKSSSTGTPATQPALPPYEGGVPGTPTTQPDLPEAPLPQEPTNPTTPTDNNNNVPGEPTDTNKGNIAPHAAEKPNKGGRTSVAHGTNAVDSNNGTINTTVHAATLGNNNQKKVNTLPQTGEKNTSAGLFGLMIAGLGAILGLAGIKKRKN